MKRSIGERGFDSLSMANCLMLLSRGVEFESVVDSSLPHRVFECKTCNRQFSSFQALGGHRASHKKPRLASGDEAAQSQGSSSSPAKPKTHECSICGLEFAIGQALGGHMRRHRAATSEGAAARTAAAGAPPLSQISVVSPAQVPVVKKSNSQRVLWLDLNLTPMENESDLEFRLGTKTAAPAAIDCYVL
ncbi:zinc finger protein ZAT12-like [Rhodamnia argentea]|uniref:Zinc finger protein ZAT12-like n=1 Tax=Rhodamnia argentea TaxID=178133 RepID=A0A8B8MNW2_9MYRT|nr:zinc finger protein ZAT12-like [Rhodamnia argentea]